MKLWQALILINLLMSPLVLSSCNLLGIGGQSKEEQYYQQQLELMQKQQELNQKAQEEYNLQLQQALNDYLKQYNDYQQSQQQQQIQALEEAAKAKEQENIPYN